MKAYAFWNNKGGVGKSFLSFIAATEYAHQHPDTSVYVLDMCPQANLSEMLLGGYKKSSLAISKLIGDSPRRTVSGYIDSRFSTPFSMTLNIDDYISTPSFFNKHIPKNISLICGDYLLEVQSEAIRQTAQLHVPNDAWRKVIEWIKDIVIEVRKRDSSSVFIIDCNPSFAIYTQLALIAATDIVVPFTADESSRRAIENVVTLLYGIGGVETETYLKINFAARAKDFGIDLPVLHSFIANRVTKYDKQPSRAFSAVIKTVKETMDQIYSNNKEIFSQQREKPSSSFIEIDDYHSASVFCGTTGSPLHKTQPGPKILIGERVQLNPQPLRSYREALEKFVHLL